MLINTGIKLGENPIHTFFIEKDNCFLSLMAGSIEEVIFLAKNFIDGWSTIYTISEYITLLGLKSKLKEENNDWK